MKRSHISIFALCLAALLCLTACGGTARESEPNDPHAGQVEVFNGSREVWITPQEGVPVNTLKSDDFTVDETGRPVYIGDEYEAVYGIDVSYCQQDVDWQQVKDSGIDFAILRIGARGYGKETGNIIEDDYFEANYAAAKAAGVKLGVNFFSQAISEEEAVEEADFVLSMLQGKDLQLPVYFDWEHISYDEARTNDINGETITDACIAFCERIKEGGFEPGVYMYAGMAYYEYDLSRLTDYDFWCASIGDYPYFYYAHTVWQYSFTGLVPGIATDCDLNIMFIKK